MKWVKVAFVILIVPAVLMAHGKEDHSGEKTGPSESKDQMEPVHQTKMKSNLMDDMMKDQLTFINRDYQADIKSIFKQKCFDCHGTPDEYPWYYIVPGVKQIMDYDIREAKKHLEMSEDFPFGGHGDPVSDLKSLKKAVEKDSMPPFRYWIVQPSSRLSDHEKEVIFSWIDQSLSRIEK